MARPKYSGRNLRGGSSSYAQSSQMDKGVKLRYLHAQTSKKELAPPPSSHDLLTIGHHRWSGKLRPVTQDISKESPTCNTVHRGLSEVSRTFLPEVTCSTHTPVIVIITIRGLPISLQASARALRQMGFCQPL